MKTRELTCIGCPLGCALTVSLEAGKVISVDVFKKNYTVLLNSGEVMTVSVEDESKK